MMEDNRNGLAPAPRSPSAPLAPTCMRLESMGAAVLTMWTLGVDVERMRCRGALAGTGKGKCSESQSWVRGLMGERL